MPAPRPTFNPPYDIHLLRGQTIELSGLLEIDRTTAADYIDANATIKYGFQTSFSASANLKITATIGNTASRKPTCKIALNAAAPTDPKFQISSFLVYVIVTDTSDNSTSETALRIHVHQLIQDVWMTPDPFTVYQGMKDARAGLYAHFDDGVVAEIGDIYFGDNGGVVPYTITNKPRITWKCTAAPSLINASGKITTGQLSGDFPVSVSVKYGTKTVSAIGKIQVSTNLSANQTTIQVELVTTGGSPGFSRLNEIPNILFLPEGFTDSGVFEDLVNNYVADLVRNKITSPFDQLKGSINFWKAFVPSREVGLTHRSVLEVYASGTTLNAYSPSVPAKPDSDDASTWTAENLLYFVGVPLKSDEAVDDAVLRLRWENTTRLTAAQLDVLFSVDNALVFGWKSSADRRLPDATDSAFGISVNDYSAAAQDEKHELINFDNRRVQRDFLDGFLGTLRDGQNNLIGPVFVMDKASGNRGKDFDNVIFLLATNAGRAQNETGYLFAGLKLPDDITLTGTLADFRTSRIPPVLPSVLPPMAKATLTHELVHSFGLGDEYGEPNSDYSNKPITDPAVANWPFANYTDGVYLTDEYSNLQAKLDLESPISGGGTALDAFKIKWRYPRIRKCSLVTAISLSGSDMVMTLKSPKADFKVNETVFFRKRRVNRFQMRVYDEKYKVEADIVSPATLAEEFIKYYVKVKSIDSVNNKITIKSDFGTTTVAVELKAGQTRFFKVGQRLGIFEKRVFDPVYTVLRTPATTAGQPDLQTLSLSPEMKVKSVTATSVTLQTVGTTPVPADLTTIHPNEELLLYAVVEAPQKHRSAQYPFAELTAKPVLDYLKANPFPLNANPTHQEIIDTSIVANSSLPQSLVPCCSRRKKEIVGLFSGGMARHGGIYHPAAKCLMFTTTEEDDKKNVHYIELCAVCRYTLINMIDPTRFAKFDEDYMSRKIYPD
ncbi:hypothetical protein [Larkinella terrae]|uniref:Uncharacterized protein n=1 Tax=Larkinella terrae TaxID=2025311 RepID=A0A7K0EQV2_9BACT|nr:hypothetical protein [Larkinella terrae]MRS63886.1 hypothetical protein [Larkinella terrae]